VLALAKKRARPQVLDQKRVPAPSGGLNTVTPVAQLPPTDALFLYNMTASEYGLRTRPGSSEWVTGLTGASDDSVPSLLPFTGSTQAQNRFFAVTQAGIWDVSASTDTPTQLVTFPIQTGEAGRGSYVAMATSAGRFLLLCDEENGLFVYTEGTDSWAQVAMGGGATEIANVSPSNFCFVTVWKRRLFFVERYTGSAWYLAAGAVYGAATEFDFAQQFRVGGSLVGLWNWSYDGGAGLDSYLVALSTGGDAVVYQGTDPASASTFGLKGSWNVGGLASGRRVALDFGGELLVLTLLGALPLSRLVAGGSIEDEKLFATRKVANAFNRLVGLYRTLPGWALAIHPEENALLVLVPTASGQPTGQWAMSFANGSWSQWRDLPMASAAVWDGTLYFGTTDGRVLKNTGAVDGVTLADPDTSQDIAWSALGAYHNLGNGRLKRVSLVRPILLSEEANPTAEATALFDFSLLEPAPPAGSGVSGSGAWGSAVFDEAVWGGDLTASQAIGGAAGMGRDVAIAVRGAAKSRTVLVGTDVFFEQGGLL
jgi:hypothetical protein